MKTWRCLWCAASLSLLAPPLKASEPVGSYGYGGYAGYAGCSTCGSGYWDMQGFCNRPLSKNDHLWDNYCQDKWHPCVDAAYLQPCWHGGPMCDRSSAPPAANTWHGASAITPVSTGGASLNHTPTRASTAEPAPAPKAKAKASLPIAPLPSHREPPAANQVKPPAPPEDAPKAEDQIELRLLPLSRQRSAQP